MNLNLIEDLAKWIGGLAAVVTLGVIFFGIWRGLHRPVSSTTGRYPGLLRKPAFYIIASLGYFGLCYLLWQPILPDLSPPASIVALILGALLYFTGLGLIIWGRLALGKQYFVSTSQSAQLFIDHKLVTRGPFAIVRHPMYLGILLTGLGGILIYRTWTFVFLALNFLGLILRARREEQVLAEEFGDQWKAYCQQVPRWLPRFRKLVMTE